MYQPLPHRSSRVSRGGTYRTSEAAGLERRLALELVPAIACSFISFSYVDRVERPDNTLCNRSCKRYLSSLQTIANPSPGLLLGACLVLGCRVSSYYQRRRDLDAYQAHLLVFWIVWVVFVALRTGSSTNMAALGILPGALCSFMMSSCLLHAVLRRLATKRQYGKAGMGEEGHGPGAEEKLPNHKT
jgi:hypothetical protein